MLWDKREARRSSLLVRHALVPRSTHQFTSVRQLLPSPGTENSTCVFSPWVLPAADEGKSHILGAHYASVGVYHLMRQEAEHREVRQPARGHTVRESGNWDLNPAAAARLALPSPLLTFCPLKFPRYPNRPVGHSTQFSATF